MIWIYRVLLLPSLWLVLWMGHWLNAKLRRGFQLRAKRNGVWPWLALAQTERPIWFHTSSGEVEYAKPILRELKRQHPNIPIILTYFSPSIEPHLAKLKEVDAYFPMPWDTVGHWRAFMRHHRPRACLIARTDTWPEMLHQLREHRIPSLLFAATITKESGRSLGLMRPFTTMMLKNLSQIFCVSEADLAILRGLGVGNVQVAGDTRFDQVVFRLSQPKAIHIDLKSSKKPTLLLGSTWSEDERVLLPAFPKLHKDWNLIICPHEPTANHIRQLEEDLAQLGLRSRKYSEASLWAQDEVLLIDEVGVLAELYQQAQVAFVGGSFRKTVHSVMEPLAAGCLTCVGPKHQNNREAQEFARIPVSPTLTAVSVLHSEKDLIEVANSFREQVSQHQIADRIRQEIGKRTGATRLVVDWLNAHVDLHHRP